MKKNKAIFNITIFLGILFLIILFNSGKIFAKTFSDIEEENYKISRQKIERYIEKGDIFRDFIEIFNTGNSRLEINLGFKGPVAELMQLKNNSISISKNSSAMVHFVVRGKGQEDLEGNLELTGSINKEIPVIVHIGEKNISQLFLIELEALEEEFNIENNFSIKTTVKKLYTDPISNISLNYTLQWNNQTANIDFLNMSLNHTESFIKSYSVPEGYDTGDYVFNVVAKHENFNVSDRSYFVLKRDFMDKSIFGFLKVWVLFLIIGIIILGLISYIIIKKRIEAKKKYKMSLDTKTIPQPSKENLFLGKIAESSHWAYLDPNKLTTHGIVAGATGGGKSITAQVIIEECLRKDIAVIVFDPTAQWSGMLRKCTDKKMMAHYSKFGLKQQDAQAFKGNVRMVKDARQVIDIEKFISPGQIQIFSLHKLDPKDMDLFVASIIRQIFKSDPKEHATLKVLLVFDEVHRLLPKFGGSGEGFLQIERGCREFRKWGLGIMLVSQVLNDFVGEIKTNIATEVQMRTRDEGDLKRIETKYGETFLQSLVKASAGFGLFSNPAYNHAQPYFMNFRPILHNTRRLTDEELEKYNKYNDKVDDLEFQMKKLEEEKIDTFDLKMELKLVKDKIMSGSFSVVDVYLEGLNPRVKKEWEKLGKKPPERKIQLVSLDEIKKSVKEAQKSKKEAKEKEKAEGGGEEGDGEKEQAKFEEKIVASITFNNGAMISSLKELKDYLPNMSDEDFKEHVSKEKNDIVKWIKEQFGAKAGKMVKGKKTKNDLVKGIEKIIKEKPKKEDSEGDKKEEEKESKDSEEKSKEEKEEKNNKEGKEKDKEDSEKKDNEKENKGKKKDKEDSKKKKGKKKDKDSKEKEEKKKDKNHSKEKDNN